MAARDDRWEKLGYQEDTQTHSKTLEMCSSWWLLWEEDTEKNTRAFGSTLFHHSGEFGSKVNALSDCRVFRILFRGTKFLRFPDGAHTQLPSIDANAPRI